MAEELNNLQHFQTQCLNKVEDLNESIVEVEDRQSGSFEEDEMPIVKILENRGFNIR